MQELWTKLVWSGRLAVLDRVAVFCGSWAMELFWALDTPNLLDKEHEIWVSTSRAGSERGCAVAINSDAIGDRDSSGASAK